MDLNDDLETHELIQPFVESTLQTEHSRLVISKRPRICPSAEKINLPGDIFFTEEAFNKYSVSSKWFENLWRRTQKQLNDQPATSITQHLSTVIPPQIPPPQPVLSNIIDAAPAIAAPNPAPSINTINKPEVEKKGKKEKKEKKEKRSKKDKQEDLPVVQPPTTISPSPSPVKLDPKKVAEAVLKNSTPVEPTPTKTKFKPPSKRTKSTEAVPPLVPSTQPTPASISSPTSILPPSFSLATTAAAITTTINSTTEMPALVPQESTAPPKPSTSPSKQPSLPPTTEPTESGTKRTLRSYVDLAPTSVKKSKKEAPATSTAPPSTTPSTVPSVPPVPTPSLTPAPTIAPSIPSTTPPPSAPSIPASIPQPVVVTIPSQPPSSIQPLVRVPSQPQQRFSMFSESDHKLFLEFQQKLLKEQQRKTMPNAASIPPHMTQLEFQQYSQMVPLVSQEQEEYRNYNYTTAMQNKDIYTIFHPKIQKQIESLFAFKRQRVLNYPKLYDIHHVFDMRTIQQSNPHEAILKHKFTLLEKGKCLLFQKPSSVEIPLNREYFPEASKWCNNNNATTQPQRTETKEQTPGTGSQLDAPQTSSTTSPKTHWSKKTMVPLESDPEISNLVSLGHKIDIVIGSSALCALMELNRQLEIPVTIKQVSDRKLVIIGKPFVKKKMTMREMNTAFFNTAFESLGLQLPSSTVRCILFDKQRKNGTEANQPQQPSLEPASKPSEEERKLEEDNLTYNLWQFGNMNVLIRCKIHGMIPAQQGVRYIGMKTKLEYMAHKGTEEVTIAETALWWAYTYIRPDAHLMLARINVLNNTITEGEHKTMPSILPPGCLFKPEKSSRIMHVLFDKLCQLPVGNYLISHKVSDYNLVLLKSVDQTPSTQDVTNASTKPETEKETSLDKYYDLHQAHKNTPVADTETVPYIPLRWIPKPNQIPETFPINKNTKSVFGSIGISHKLVFLNETEPQYCQQFLTTGSCTAIGCGLLHARPEQAKKLKLKFCRNFAQFGSCNKINCKYPHLKQDEIKSRMDELGIQKKKKKKKKKKDKQTSPTTTDDRHLDFDSNKPIEVDMEDMGSEDDFESQLAMHISKQKSSDPSPGNTNNGATEDLAYIMSVLQ